MPWEKQFDIDDRLDRAMQRFWARGFEATSMQDLVDSMGVNRGSLYGTYGDKRSLFLSALRMYDDRVRRQTLARLEAGSDSLGAIRGVFEMFAEPALRGRPARGCFLTNSALELAAHDPEVREVVARSQRQTEAFFARMIKRGKANGEIGGHVKPNRAARSLLATLQGLIVLTRSRPEKKLLRAVIDDAMRPLK